jgi:hypothetical protein
MKKEFIVKKLVEYQYTIEAETEERAENTAAFLDPSDADQYTILEIDAESPDDYWESLGVTA